MRPVRRSTSSQPPRCHCQRAAFSPGSASLMRNTRRTTNRRSVTSCELPVVYSLTLVSGSSGRTLRSNMFSPVAFGHLAEVHLPNVMTCGLGTATHTEQKSRRAKRTATGGNSVRTVVTDDLRSIPRDCPIRLIDCHDL